MTYVYILERNGVPFYVGKTKDPIRRKHRHYQKYGNDIKLIIIDDIKSNKKQDWKPLECFWIEYIKFLGFKLLNENKGGGGPQKYSEESKMKMRGPRPHTGKKISKSLKKNNHSSFYTKEVREKISKGNINMKKPFSKSHKINMGIAKRKNAKPVLQLDLQGNLIKEWESKGLAAEWIKQKTGRTSNIASQIKDCILGRQKTVYKYKWKYKYE